MAKTYTPERFSAPEQERPTIDRLAQMLKPEHSHAKLVGADGEEILLPESVHDLFREVLEVLLDGHAVSIMPSHHELSTQEAADFLNISRPYLYKLLNEGQISYHKAGTHRRIRCDDLNIYKQMRDLKRQQGLKELTQMTEELGLYEDDDFLEED